MGVADRSRERVEEVLSELEAEGRSFPVTQTTVSVSTERYERVADHCREGIARIDVRVRDGDEVLLVHKDGDLDVPTGTVDRGESIETRARQTARLTAGVECVFDTVEEVVIVGVHDGSDPDRDPVYRIIVLSSCQYVSGSPPGTSAWQPEAPAPALLR